MKPAKTRRTKYPPDVYARKLSDLTQLLTTIPRLQADRLTWDMAGDYTQAGEVSFIDAEQMTLFAPFADFDCRSIKLVNYNQPAVKMHFSMTHRYWLLKDADLTLAEKQQRTSEYLEKITVHIDKLQLIMPDKTGLARQKLLDRLRDYQHRYHQWSAVATNLANYELSVSNYNRQYYYLTINYKYFDESADIYRNLPVHLLNNQRDNDGQVTQYRQNIVFVDTAEIQLSHPYQTKLIEKFLGRFELVAETGREQLYARVRSTEEQANNPGTARLNTTLPPVEEPAPKPQKLSKVAKRQPSLELPLFD